MAPICKAKAKFVTGERLGTEIQCRLVEENHGKRHVAYTRSDKPEVHREPGYDDIVNITYTWDGEFVG